MINNQSKIYLGFFRSIVFMGIFTGSIILKAQEFDIIPPESPTIVNAQKAPVNELRESKSNNQIGERAPASDSALSNKSETRSPDSISPANQSLGVLEKLYQGISQDKNTHNARRKIIEEANLKVSEEVIRSIIGEERFKKHRSLITDKIYRQVSRYIPVVKAGELVTTAEGSSLQVTLQVNTRILESILRDNGLMFETQTAQLIMPFLSIDDGVRGFQNRWWAHKNPSLLSSMSEFMEDQLQKTFFENGFFVQRPIASQMGLMVPISSQQDLLDLSMVRNLSQRWNFPMALMGDLKIRKESNDFVFDLNLSVYQVSSGRVLAQLFRQQKISQIDSLEALQLKKHLSFVVEAYGDLSQQIFEAGQRGVLNSNLVRLEIQGALPINKYELFKESLKSSQRSIRQVRERLITADSTIFELEISGSINDLAGGLNQITVGDKIYRSKGINGGNTILMGIGR